MHWTSNGMIALYIALAVVIGAVGIWFVVRKTLRTRIATERILRDDPDLNDWLVIFGWTPKVLYVPTIAAAFIACFLMFLRESDWRIFAGIDPKLVGGLWFVIFFLNFLIEEYDINVKMLLLAGAVIGFLLLWLHLLGLVLAFLGLFKHLAFSISATGYLLIAIIGILTIFVSWLRGLFYYVAITPNCLDFHRGPTEAGEQVGREDYNTKVDTSDFLERLLGFGRITITFKDNTRPPSTLLVWRVERKAQMLERVRAKFAVDQPRSVQESPALQTPSPPPDVPGTQSPATP
ncbi:MAG: hypothetical protein JW955_11355 [Sedimentisphaerales bacterium]|nr:hypothetical protein [Sedimentisphaerales bacterium]